MSRLPQILFLCEFWAETASEKEAVPCQNSSWNEKWYGSRERRPEYHYCLHRARRLWRAGTHVRVQHIYIRTGENSIRTRRLDRNGGGGLQVAPEKGLDPKLPCGSCRSASTRVRPIAGGRVANVVSKFRSGAALLSFSVTARRRGIQRESPSNLTNGQETGKIFQRKMFHVLTVFFASFGVSCSTPSLGQLVFALSASATF